MEERGFEENIERRTLDGGLRGTLIQVPDPAQVPDTLHSTFTGFQATPQDLPVVRFSPPSLLEHGEGIPASLWLRCGMGIDSPYL